MPIYHQGQLDFFCAVYAAINALGILRPISLAPARNAFADILEGIAGHKRLWEATTRNASDFHWLVKYSLARLMRSEGFPVYSVTQPFHPADPFSPEASLDLNMAAPYRPVSSQRVAPRSIWHVLENWLPRRRPGDNPAEDSARKRAAILRFQRYMRPGTPPFVLHWSAADALTDAELLLRDASREQDALHSLPREQVVFHADGIHSNALLHIEPESLFLLEHAPS